MGKKKVLAFTVAAFFTAAALAAEVSADGFFYHVNDKQGVTITGCFGGLASLVIPERIQDMPVTAIGNGAFAGCAGLSGITIPSSVRSVGEQAFLFCKNLAAVTLLGPAALGTGAFPDTTRVNSEAGEAPHPPDGLTYRIINNRSVTITKYSGIAASLVIPEAIQDMPVTAIREWAFDGRETLTSVSVPQSVQTIGKGAFYGCGNLTGVVIPQSVILIGQAAFFRCERLTSITLSKRTAIGERAFPGLTRITYRD